MSEITDKYGLIAREPQPAPKPYVPPYNAGERKEEEDGGGGAKPKPQPMQSGPSWIQQIYNPAPTMNGIRQIDALTPNYPSVYQPAVYYNANEWDIRPPNTFRSPPPGMVRGDWLGNQTDLSGRPLGIAGVRDWWNRQTDLSGAKRPDTIRPANIGGIQQGSPAPGWLSRIPGDIKPPSPKTVTPVSNVSAKDIRDADAARLRAASGTVLKGGEGGTVPSLTENPQTPFTGGIPGYKPGGFNIEEIADPNAKPYTRGWVYPETPPSYKLGPYANNTQPHVAGYYIWGGKYYPIGGHNPGVGVLGANDGTYRNYWGWWNVPRSALPGYNPGGGYGGGGYGGGGGRNNSSQYYNALMNWEIS